MNRKSRLWMGSIALIVSAVFLYGVHGICFFLIVNNNSQLGGFDQAASFAHYSTDAFFKVPIMVCLAVGAAFGILSIYVKDSS